MDRLEKLKQEAIENPPVKVKGGCKSCKKKKEITEKLPQLEQIFIPTIEDIKKAYIMLGNPKKEEKKFIMDVYQALFNEEFDFECRSCVHTQTTILKNYIVHQLKIKL